MPTEKETRGRKPLSFEDKLASVPLRLYPHEIAEIERRAKAAGISRQAWRQAAIRKALEDGDGVA